MSSRSNSNTAPEAEEPSPARRTWSLALRLTFWYGLSAFLLILGATGFLYWALVSNLDREDDELLLDKVHILQTLLRHEPQDTRMLSEEVEWEPSVRQYGQVWVAILEPSGRPILETPGIRARLPSDLFANVGAWAEKLGRGADVTTPAGASFRLLAARATRGSADHPDAIVLVALDRSREADLLSGYRRYLWFVLSISLIVCLLTAHQIARRGLKPLAAITEGARRIRSSTLHERMKLPGLPVELAVLADTFNEMLDRLQDSFDRLARFSGDIAHELRSPVNNLRGEAEVALGKPRSAEEYREVLSSALEECGRLTFLIDNLLFVARAENPQTHITRERVELSKELAALCEYYEPAAAAAGVSLSVSAPQGIQAEVDRALLQRALGNLVANSLAHTPPGGSIAFLASSNGTSVSLEVADTGSGVPPQDLPRVFDRFYRADPARRSADGHVGLGLAIVKAIAELHGGKATIASEIGKGTCVTLAIPLRAPESQTR